jgi:hypothetical protein
LHRCPQWFEPGGVGSIRPGIRPRLLGANKRGAPYYFGGRSPVKIFFASNLVTLLHRLEIFFRRTNSSNFTALTMMPANRDPVRPLQHAENMRPAARPETEALIQRVIAEKFGGHGNCSLPETGDQFIDPGSAFARVQQYAFAHGFAVVESQWDPQQHRRVYSCVHYGKPKNTRKLVSDAVSRETYNELDGVNDEGQNLRLRQGMVRAV